MYFTWYKWISYDFIIDPHNYVVKERKLKFWEQKLLICLRGGTCCFGANHTKEVSKRTTTYEDDYEHLDKDGRRVIYVDAISNSVTCPYCKSVALSCSIGKGTAVGYKCLHCGEEITNEKYRILHTHKRSSKPRRRLRRVGKDGVSERMMLNGRQPKHRK